MAAELALASFESFLKEGKAHTSRHGTAGLSEESMKNFQKVGENSWSRSPLITSERFFRLSSCDDTFKLSFLCLLCPLYPGVHISSHASSTGNLRVHVARKHPSHLQEFDELRKGSRKRRKIAEVIPVNQTESWLKANNFFPSSIVGSSTSLSTSSSPEKQFVFEKALQSFLVDAMLSPSIAENPKFVEMLCCLSPVSVPSSSSITLQIRGVTEVLKSLLKEKLRRQSYVCLTVDIRTTNLGRFLGVTGHWIDECFLQRKSAVLRWLRYDEDKTFENVGEKLVVIAQEYEIEKENIVATVTNNESSFGEVFKELHIQNAKNVLPNHDEDDSGREGEFDSLEDPHMKNILEKVNITTDHSSDVEASLPAHMQCFSYTLSLLVTVDIKISTNGRYGKLHRDVLKKCSALWSCVETTDASEVINEVFDEQLCIPRASSWNSFYDSLAQAVRVKDKLNDLMVRLGIPFFTEPEIKFMEEYVSVLHPIATALDLLQKNKSCFFGSLLPTLLAVEKKLDHLRSHSLCQCEPLLNALINGFQLRFADFLQLRKLPAVLAASSHPRFKLKWLTISQNLNNESTRKFARELLLNAVEALNDNLTPASSSGSHLLEEEADSCFDAFFGFEDSNASAATVNSSNLEMETLRYLRDSRSSLESLHDFPGVKKVFLKYNTPLASSALVESFFNFSGYACASAGSLSDELFEDYVFQKGNSSHL